MFNKFLKLPKLNFYNLLILTVCILLAIIVMYPNCLYNNILEGNTSKNTPGINEKVIQDFSRMDSQGSGCNSDNKSWNKSILTNSDYTLDSTGGNCMDYCNYKTYNIMKDNKYPDLSKWISKYISKWISN